MSALTEAEKECIDQLLEKFTNKTLKKEAEAKELQVLLEKRKKETFDLGDFLLATGTVFLLAGLIVLYLKNN